MLPTRLPQGGVAGTGPLLDLQVPGRDERLDHRRQSVAVFGQGAAGQLVVRFAGAQDRMLVEDLPQPGGEVGVGGVLLGQGRPGAGDGLFQVLRFDGLHLHQAQPLPQEQRLSRRQWWSRVHPVPSTPPMKG
ncbi:hypothetical protein ACYAFX_28205 (plasmid) [Rhodococcus aetherivorans]